MAAKHAVLGLVIERPDHGYKLAKRLHERCGPCSWSPQAVYKSLVELADSKHVRARDTPPATKEDQRRTVYEATQGGIDYFAAWMCNPAALVASRSELELKIVLARPYELQALIEMTWAQEQQCVDRLATLVRAAQGSDKSSETLSWSDIGVRLVGDTEIKRLRLRVEWLQEARGTMRLFLARTAERSPHRRPKAG
jgi:DNA-binding PadR family transcriptional regulator